MVGPRPEPEPALGRELALLTLCHLESYPVPEQAAAVDVLWDHPPATAAEGGPDLAALVATPGVGRAARRLLSGWHGSPAEIDAAIEAASDRWRLARMDRVDRNVLRLCAIELRDDPKTPRAVVLSEAVRLAARYGSETSSRFVNGVIETLAQRLRPEAS